MGVESGRLGHERRDRIAEFTGEPKRDEVFSKDPYILPDYVRLENERLWPRVWQIACREEQIPKVGDFWEYTIGPESIIVIRTAPGEIRAHYNTCPHRGRRLVVGHGNAKQFKCGFHGWRFNIDGSCAEIVDGDEYFSLCKADAALSSVKVGTWQGWVFVNMDPKAEPLLDYLGVVPEYLDPYDFGHMRIRWHKSTIVQANWKTNAEAFMENYHSQTTHFQIIPYYDDRLCSFRNGLHGHFGFPPDFLGFGVPAPRLGVTERRDPRQLIKTFLEYYEKDIKGGWTPRDVRAVQAVLELPEDMPAPEVYAHYYEVVKELGRREGAGERSLTPEQMFKAGTLWHVFPNHVVLPNHNGVTAYTFRPNGDDPHTGIMDLWSLGHFSPDETWSSEHQFFTNWKDHNDWGQVFSQDFENLKHVQAGMRSRGFKGLRLNPIQETVIANFRTNLEHYLSKPGA